MLLYQKIQKYIQTHIASGELAIGDKLPSERTLQEHFNSTRITVREALNRLEAEGLIYSQKRRGWFVTPNKLKWRPATKVNFYQLAQEQGFTPNTHVLSIEKQENLSLNQHFSGDTLYKIERVRSLDGRPIMFEQINCDASRFDDLESQPLNGSITTIMTSHYHVDINNEECVISVTVLPDDVAKSLEKNSGAPCLKVIRQRYESIGILIDYNIEYWLHDAIEMIVIGQ